jgi:hypothetical protein
MLDVRSATTLKIMNANPRAYEALVVRGSAPAQARELLDGVEAGQLVEGIVTSQAHASMMLAALWLWHDGLDECHRIVQDKPDATGSFWHAIMHRREGDFSNSKYWYARCANHPALDVLGAQAGAVVNSMPADRSLLRVVMRGFDPNALVDLAEEVRDRPNDERYRAAVSLQQLEWRILFDHCVRLAVG